MKRSASRPAPYEIPAKLAKGSSAATVSRKLSTLRRTVTTDRAPMPPPKWASIKSKSPSVRRLASLPKPDWPALVPTSKSRKESDSPSAVESIVEVSEEPATHVPGLRRMSTLPLEDENEVTSGKTLKSSTLSKAGSKSKSLSRNSSSASGVTPVATLQKKGSVTTLDTDGAVTTITRLASGSSIGETVGLSVAPPSIRKELSKAASSAAPIARPASKKISSIRVFGVDAPEELPAVPLPPGGLIEIVFSFDTTGSMSSCLNEVRGRVGDMIQRLQADIPGIRIAVIAHGDYSDASTAYVIKWIDFGSSLPEMTEFVRDITGTGGGDFDECYELVLARARTELSWTPGSQRSLVMIGDATPHPPSFYNDRDEKLDWMEETKKLADMDVKIYAVQAMGRTQCNHFYSSLASMTGGHHLNLNLFNNIFDILMMLCYNERGPAFVQAYEDEVRTRIGDGPIHNDLDGLFRAFRGAEPSTATKVILAKGAAKRKTSATTKRSAAPTGKASSTKGKRKAGTSLKGKPVLKAKGATKKTTAKAASKSTATKKAKGKGVKPVKGRKPTKKTMKKKTKKPVSGVKRKFREAIKDEDLSTQSCMKKVAWSPWHKAIIPSSPKPKGSESHQFKNYLPKYQSVKSGLRNMKILKDGSNAPAVYELAVQLKPKKRYSVFFKACSSWPRGVVWDTVLLKSPSLRQEVNAVLAAGGQIWVRRGKVKTLKQLMQVKAHVHKMYDYAWESRKAARGSNTRVRRLKKCKVLISGNSNS